jgi:hypothetical protein
MKYKEKLLITFLCDKLSKKDFFFPVGPTQSPIEWEQRAFRLRVKRPEREANQSPQSSSEVEVCVELYPHSPKYAFMASCSFKAQGQIYLTWILQKKYK